MFHVFPVIDISFFFGTDDSSRPWEAQLMAVSGNGKYRATENRGSLEEPSGMEKLTRNWARPCESIVSIVGLVGLVSFVTIFSNECSLSDLTCTALDKLIDFLLNSNSCCSKKLDVAAFVTRASIRRYVQDAQVAASNCKQLRCNCSNSFNIPPSCVHGSRMQSLTTALANWPSVADKF